MHWDAGRVQGASAATNRMRVPRGKRHRKSEMLAPDDRGCLTSASHDAQQSLPQTRHLELLRRLDVQAGEIPDALVDLVHHGVLVRSQPSTGATRHQEE